MKRTMDVALPIVGTLSLFVFAVVVLLTGPAPHSQLFALTLSPITSADEKAQISSDQTLSLLEVNEISCRRLREQRGDASMCWIVDHWPLPKSIVWPLNL